MNASESLAQRLQPDIGMRSASWMLAQLEFATRAHHIGADAGRVALLGASTSRERYEEYLARVFHFEAPIESRWQEVVGLESVVDPRPRLRVGFLISDLAALGARPEMPAAAQFVGVEQALGWMYVVERGRRMNALLYRHLLRRLPQEMTIAGNYLNASSPCGTRWQQFGEALDRFADNHVIVEQIVNAAQRAFRSQRTSPRFTASLATLPAA
jgi:heme oxygenase